MDLGDVFGRELVAAAVVGKGRLDVEAELGQACGAEDARGGAVHVDSISFDALVGERVIVDGMKRGHGGGPLDRGRW
ncbi:hypothetical protein PL81_18445 [Streptomyces sp. RSD-27]|nr:hypothetical protein PL81_18445 [Streptomyces sp. RSD-27]